MLSAGLLISSADAADPLRICQKVAGTMQETILPQETAPNDPFGRILGSFSGNMGGATNASITAFLVTPPAFSSGPLGNSQVMQVRHAFLTGPGDVITTLGKTIFNVAPATLPGETTYNSSRCPGTPCVVQNPQVLTITGGTGRWAGASGELRNLGLGNLNLPQGQGTFTFVVAGEVCLPSSSVSANSKSNPEF